MAMVAPVHPAAVPAAPPAAPASSTRASPAAGTTGTAILPVLPVDAREVPARGDVATPFSTAGLSALDRGRAVECLAAAVYYEANGESDDGGRAVAQVVLNRVRHAAFTDTVCGVVYQGSERGGCQFSFACNGAALRVPSRAGWSRAARIAAAALAGRVFAPVGLATHYHTFAVTPAWNRSLVMTGAVGAHFFHRWKGWWGRPPAFSKVYRGREPLPGAHPAAVPDASVVGAVVPVPLVPTPPPTVSAANDDPLAARAAAASTVLDRWKDSGTPLR